MEVLKVNWTGEHIASYGDIKTCGRMASVCIEFLFWEFVARQLLQEREHLYIGRPLTLVLVRPALERRGITLPIPGELE